MADVALQSVLRQLRRWADPKGVAALTDAQLLHRFVTARDEAAFEVVVWRHGPMVLGTCRRLLGNDHAAEDAFQAAFLTLARKAGSITKATSLPAWLCRVASRIALELRTQARKRQAWQRHDVELAAVADVATDGTDAEKHELWSVLIEELHRMPACYRGPLVSCYLQGKTHVEAARELNQPLGSISSRLSRGCELLRDRLTRRGACLSTVALVALLTDKASAALSASLVLPTVTAVLEFSVGAAISSPAVVLAKGVIQSMMLSKVKA